MTTMNQIIRGLPPHEYHASGGVSNSMLSDFAISPYHCWALHHAPGRPTREPTDAMRAGTLLHTMVLEPSEVPRRYIVRPDGLDMRTKDGKAWAAQADGLEIINAAQYAAAEAQRDAILAVPELAALLASGQPEVSAYWTDQATGLQCRMRADWVHPLDDGRVMLLDLKTAADVTPEGFARSIAQYGYHRQAAWYSTGYSQAAGVEVCDFVLGVVSKAYPYVAAAYLIDADSIQQGRDECAEMLERYAECQRTGYWPAFVGYQSISLPAWAKRSEEVEVSFV